MKTKIFDFIYGFCLVLLAIVSFFLMDEKIEGRTLLYLFLIVFLYFFIAYVLTEGIRIITIVLTTRNDYYFARKILGKDFISPERLMKSFGRKDLFTKEQIEKLRETMPDIELLEFLEENNFFLFPGTDEVMNLIEVFNVHKGYFFPEMKLWCLKSNFATKDKVCEGWYAVSKTIILKSIGRDWKEQKELVSEIEKIPNAVELAWAILVYLIVNGIWLYNGTPVRTISNHSRRKFKVIVGVEEHGSNPLVYVRKSIGNGPNYNLGLTTMIKPEILNENNN